MPSVEGLVSVMYYLVVYVFGKKIRSITKSFLYLPTSDTSSVHKSITFGLEDVVKCQSCLNEREKTLRASKLLCFLHEFLRCHHI